MSLNDKMQKLAELVRTGYAEEEAEANAKLAKLGFPLSDTTLSFLFGFCIGRLNATGMTPANIAKASEIIAISVQS